MTADLSKYSFTFTKALLILSFISLIEEDYVMAAKISNASNFSSSILTKEVDTLKAVREWKDNF